MESPLCTTAVERKMPINKMNNQQEAALTAASSAFVEKMSSSLNSTLEDTTPSDSGIQLLDSESSELMVESITSQNGFEFEDVKAITQQMKDDNNSAEPNIMELRSIDDTIKVDSNFNVTTMVEDAMTTSTCSTFDTAENIVYRRKVRKSPTVQKAPKKRVSFHEDILKNTRTDNIHIEHGFISYKNSRKMPQHKAVGCGRYSWCSEGDRCNRTGPTELCDQSHDDGGNEEYDGEGRPRRRVVYRNACSDVLDYGNSEVFDTNETKCLQYDNSGVFEYVPRDHAGAMDDGNIGEQAKLYKCSCSSSNSSLDSEESDKNSNTQKYGQAKSSSCDCIGMNTANNNIIGENCYFSEPNMDELNESPFKKSVWNKEKKPKTSCLKKTKRHTNVIHEQDLNSKVKKFNVHDMNQLFDNSKMIFGSLKSIFTLPLPERGVPEGSEDLQCVEVAEPEPTPEHKQRQQYQYQQQYEEAISPTIKAKPFLSKSLDGSKKQQAVKKFVHNVDEQLRHKNEEEIYAPTRQSSAENGQQQQQQQQQHPHQQQQHQQQYQHQQQQQQQQEQETQIQTKILQRQDEIDNDVEIQQTISPMPKKQTQQFRNKFIINCESTVFEHTGVSISYETNYYDNLTGEGIGETSQTFGSVIGKDTPIAQPETDKLGKAFISTPIAKTFTNFFRNLKESATTPTGTINKKITDTKKANTDIKNIQNITNSSQYAIDSLVITPTESVNSTKMSKTISSSTISDLTSASSSSLHQQAQIKTTTYGSFSNSLAIGGQELRNSIEKQSRHLPSPLKKRTSGGNLMPQRYGNTNNINTMINNDNNLLSPDLYNNTNAMGYAGGRGGSGRDSKSTILSEEFDDILTITTDTDKNESDIVIVDYPELSERPSAAMGDYMNLLKPPQPPAKTSLINRFLRNVTQKKILESSIRHNNFFADKLKNEQKRFSGNLYMPGIKPKNLELLDDLNAEIAMEIEMSSVNSPRRELVNIDSDMPGDMSRFELGIGEISIDIFNGNYLHILRNSTEQLMKVFKLYIGYSREGFMIPVLVFLTDKTLYVTDLVRNCLCSRFVLAYSELDVILMGIHGNTVLLSNSSRDMQQVLLAGGPYPADRLVANLELCARRGGSKLPAVGQLTLEHLAPLQAFVRDNSSVEKNEPWMYYAVVNVPAGMLGLEQEPLGPHVKGFLMHRRIRYYAVNPKQNWNPGYFLLKAGVLYMFNDSSQKLPSWAMALAECQGARRAIKTGRPHCFEIMLKDELLQLAAPDEYVASEWLQALLQAASGLFEMQDKHKTLGCTLVITQNHLITLREDFTTPLRRLNRENDDTAQQIDAPLKMLEDLNSNIGDVGSVLSSTTSTPTRNTQRSCSSINSTPTILSQASRSTTTGGNTITSTTSSSANAITTFSKHKEVNDKDESYSNMSSVYGKNSGIEILTCADIKDMTGIKIPSHNDTWWCILEFSCQEVRESTDDLVIFFASNIEMQRFLRLFEQLWHAKNNDLFPITVLDEDDLVAEQCTMLYMDINRSWEPLLTAALGYPL